MRRGLYRWELRPGRWSLWHLIRPLYDRPSGYALGTQMVCGFTLSGEPGHRIESRVVEVELRAPLAGLIPDDVRVRDVCGTCLGIELADLDKVERAIHA